LPHMFPLPLSYARFVSVAVEQSPGVLALSRSWLRWHTQVCDEPFEIQHPHHNVTIRRPLGYSGSFMSSVRNVAGWKVSV
jgi:hypothetical protein